MAEWWNAMSLTSQIFSIIGIAGTLLLLIQVILLLAGLGGGTDIDGAESIDGIDDVDGVDAAGDGIFGEDGSDTEIPDAGLHVLTLRGIISFFAIAGWVGVICDKSGFDLWMSILIACAAGFVVMLLMALLMKYLYSLQSDGTADIRNALGASGTVYIRVPANRSGIGKVNIILQGSLSELEAVTDEPEDLAYGVQITVVGISGGNTLIVKKK